MSQYVPRNEPASWGDRLLSHPGLVLVAWWSMMVAIQVVLDPFVPSALFSRSLGEIPAWLGSAMGSTIGGGGTAVLIGILNRWDNRTRAWAVEKAGWVLLSAGWVAYALVVMRAYPGSTISWGTPMVYALIAVVRCTALRLTERDAMTKRDAIATGELSAAPDEAPPAP